MAKKYLTPEELQQVSNLKLKKAHVPLLICLKLALKNMWKKKFRYLVMFLICSLSLTFLSVTIELNGEILRQNVYTMVENGYRFTEIYEHLEVPKAEIKKDPYKEYASKDLTPNSYDKILNTVDGIILHEYEEVNIPYAQGEIENKNYFYTGYINTIIKYDSRNSYELLAGRLPEEGTTEILITDYLVEAFKYFKIYPSHETFYDFLNQRITLSSADNTYTIVGIIKTNFQNWSHFSNVETVNVDDKENYSYINDFKFMNSVILTEEYFNDEKVGGSILPFTNASNASMYQSLGRWKLSAYNYEKDAIVDYETAITIGFTKNNLTLVKKHGHPYSSSFGRYPKNENEIVISYTAIKNLYDFNWKLYTDSRTYGDYWQRQDHYDFWDQIEGTEITLSLRGIGNNETYEKTFTIVGIGESTASIAGSKTSPQYQINKKAYEEIYYKFNTEEENILVELPTDADDAYKLVNNALKAGYVINVWEYQADIDSYVVDPFLDLASKAGLFIFAAFTMGIMWTIISIEIVDSKKEIGILRSIGLSGAKVSFIFVFQCASMILLSYFVGVYGGYKIIPYLNVGITDEFNKITLYMYSFTYRTPLYLGIFVILMTAISTIIPLWKILSNKIIDVINERDN